MIPHRTRVKVCGIRDAATARVAIEAGADALGLVFHRASPRHVDPGSARAIALSVPPFVSVVGLFVNGSASEVQAILREVPLAVLQFHGDEESAYCEQFGRPWIKAVRVGPTTDLLECARRFSGASGLLLDAHVQGRYGGTGTSFDWSLIPARLPAPVILSGGLDAENVGDAIRRVAPWAVDVSSGVESEPGVKDPRRIAQFLRSVRHADAHEGR